MSYTYDAAEIRRAWQTYVLPGQVAELRALNCKVQGEWKRGTYSGYFDHESIEELIAAIARIEHCDACYFTPNCVDPRLLARSKNRARMIEGKMPTTSDHDIIRRRWLLIDIDVTRPAGISATDKEKRQAELTVIDVDHYLWHLRFPPGVICDSGNGWHLTIPIDLPADDGGMVQGLLKKLAAEFDSDHCKIDLSVFNPARIWKLPGTEVRKGDNTPDRPWRMARIVRDCRNA